MTKPSKSPPKLSGIGYREAIKVFQTFGFSVVRQVGSHITMTKQRHLFVLTIPAHKTLAEGTLRGLIRNAGITPAEFVSKLS